MRFRTNNLGGSPKDEDYGDMAHILCKSEQGYFFSLTRYPDEQDIEIIVIDQVNSRTDELFASLSSNRLLVTIPPSVAAKLDGETEYVIDFEASAERLTQIDESLAAIFKGVGTYEKDF